MCFVDEFMTSQRCSKGCDYERNQDHRLIQFMQNENWTRQEVLRMVKNKKNKKVIQELTRNKYEAEDVQFNNVHILCNWALQKVLKPWGVRVCPHCRTRWDRDINACLNMIYLFYCAASGRTRPQALRRSNVNIEDD